MKRFSLILAGALLAVSSSAFAWSFFSKDAPLTVVAVSATASATPSVTPLPAPTVDLKATSVPASSPLAKTAVTPGNSPKTKGGKSEIQPKEKLATEENLMDSTEVENLDFAPKKFDIMVPPPEDWSESLLDASGVNGLYSYLFDHEGRRKKRSRHLIKIGTIYLPTTMLSTGTVSSEGDFTLRRLAIQYALVPRPNGISQVKRYIKGFRVEFLISANNQNCIQIKDILPSTLFMNANYGGKLGVSTAVCMSSAGEFMPASEARQDAGGSFVWTYQPKNLEIVSGAVGNSAFVEFEPKNDGTFYVGQVPIEISLMVPRNIKTADLKIVNTLITNDNKLLPMGEISSKVILP